MDEGKESSEGAPDILHMEAISERDTITTLNEWCLVAHGLAQSKGFRSAEHAPTAIALMHQELSELLDTYRSGTNNVTSRKVPPLSNAAEECADLFLRLANFCGAHKIDLGLAVCLKHRYNIGRPHKHGRLF